MKRAALVVLALGSPAAAGDRLGVDELAARSEGAVILDVVRSGGKEALVVREVIAGADPGLAAWTSDCVPSRVHLRRWVADHPGWPARALWWRALVAPRFQSLVFLKTRAGQLEPWCELEAMGMEHTSLHPGWRGYVARVRGSVARVKDAWRDRLR